MHASSLKCLIFSKEKIPSKRFLKKNHLFPHFHSQNIQVFYLLTKWECCLFIHIIIIIVKNSNYVECNSTEFCWLSFVCDRFTIYLYSFKIFEYFFILTVWFLILIIFCFYLLYIHGHVAYCWNNFEYWTK